MDNLASLHAVHGFLNLHHHRKSTNSTQNRVRHGSRSMSLSDRRGLITAPRMPARKSSISPLPQHKKLDMESVDTFAMLMHLMEEDAGGDPVRGMFLPMKSLGVPTHKPVVWQHMRRTVPIGAEASSHNCVGEVLLTLRYHVPESCLSVNVIQAKDIRGMQNCDIFISIQLLQRCKILEKHETSSKQLMQKISFKEILEFNVPFAFFYYDDANLLVKVCQDTKNAEEIGHFVIGPQGNMSGVQHWKQTFSCPNTSFSAWHRLTPAIRYPNAFPKSL